MTASAIPNNPSPAATGNGLSQKAALFKKRLLGKTKTVAARAPSLDRPRRPDDALKAQDSRSEGREPAAAHMDSCLSWAILGAAIVTAILSGSVNLTFSILFGDWLKSMEMSATVISWTYNVHLFIWYMVTSVSGPLAQRFGWRAASLPPAFITAAVFALFPYVTSQITFFFLYSVVLATTAGICYQVTFLILPAYFQKNRGLALCLNSASNSIGQMIIPQLIRLLSDRFDTEGTILAYSGILLLVCAATALFKPLRNQPCSVSHNDENVKDKNEHRCFNGDIEQPRDISTKTAETKERESESGKNNELKLYFKRCFTSLKQPIVLINGFSYGMFNVGHVNFTMLIPFIVTEAGYTMDDATYLLSTFAVCNLAGRVTDSLLSDRSFFNTKLFYMFGGVVSAVFCVLFAVNLSSWEWVMASICIYGFGSGVTAGIYRLLLLETVGLEAYPSAMAGAASIGAFLFLTVAPLMGVARDYSSSFHLSMLLAAALKLASVFIWLLQPVAIRHQAGREGENRAGREHELEGGVGKEGCRNDGFVGDDETPVQDKPAKRGDAPAA